MAVQAAGQITLIDLTDARVAQLSLESSGPQVQVFEKPSNSYSPDYSANAVVVTPKLYLGNNLQEIERTKITYVIQGGEEIIYLTATNSSQNGFQLNDDCSLTISENIPISQDRYYIQATIQDFTDSITGLIQENITASIEFTLLQNNGTVIPKVNLEADNLISILENESYNPSVINLVATIEGFDFNQIKGAWYRNDNLLEEVEIKENLITYSYKVEVSEDTLPATYSFSILDGEGNELGKDQITLVILKNGEDGAAVGLIVSNENTNVSCEKQFYEGKEYFSAYKPGEISTTIKLYQGLEQIILTDENTEIRLSEYNFPHSVIEEYVYLTFGASITDGSILISGKYGNEDSSLHPFEAGTLSIEIIYNDVSYNTAISWAPITGGQNGEDSVYLKITSSNGTILTENNKSTTLIPTVYRGGKIVQNGITYSWYSADDVNNKQVSTTYIVNRSDFTNIKTLFCEAKLPSGEVLTDQITIMDKTDPIVSEIVCSLGDKFVNGIIPKTTVLTCNLYKGNSSYTPPSGTIYRWLKMEDKDKDNILEKEEDEIIPVKESEDNFYQIEDGENNEIIDNQKIIYQCEVILPTTVSTVETIE